MGFTFSIKQGWNFLSSFGYPNSLNNIINNQAISNDIVVLFFLNLSHSNGPRYDSLTVDDNLEQGQGYWLYSQNNHINIAINTNDETLISADSVSLSLKQGWNMISSPFYDSYRIEHFPFKSRIESIYSYDTNTEDYQEIGVDVSGALLEYGIGYWMKLSSEPTVSELSNIIYIPTIQEVLLQLKYTIMYDQNNSLLPNDLLGEFNNHFIKQNILKIEVKSTDDTYGIGAFSIGFDKQVELASGSVSGIPVNWNQYPSGGQSPLYSYTRCAVFAASDDWNIGTGYNNNFLITGTLSAGVALSNNNVINMDDWTTLCYVTSNGGAPSSASDLPIPNSSDILIYPEGKYNDADKTVCQITPTQKVELEIKYTRLYDESHNILPTELHPDFSSSFNRQTVVKIEVKLNDINYGIGAFDMTFDKNVEPASGSIDGFQINWNNYPNNSAGSTGPVSYSRNKCAVFSASDNWNIGHGSGTTYKIFGTLSTGTALSSDNTISTNDEWVTLCYVTTDNVSSNSDLPVPVSTEFLVYPTDSYNNSDRIILTPSPVEIL